MSVLYTNSNYIAGRYMYVGNYITPFNAQTYSNFHFIVQKLQIGITYIRELRRGTCYVTNDCMDFFYRVRRYGRAL